MTTLSVTKQMSRHAKAQKFKRTVPQNEKPFRTENFYKYQFLIVVIFHESKKSWGLIILLFELWWGHVKTTNTLSTDAFVLRGLQEYPLVSQSFLLIRYTNLSTDHKMENKWELSIMNLTSDIFMEAFFGCRVDPNSMYKCLKGSWHKGRFVFRIKLTQPIKLKSE